MLRPRAREAQRPIDNRPRRLDEKGLGQSLHRSVAVEQGMARELDNLATHRARLVGSGVSFWCAGCARRFTLARRTLRGDAS